MSDKNYQELYLKARKIYEAATVAYKELVSYTDVLEKDQLKAATIAIEKAKKTCLALQQKAKKGPPLKITLVAANSTPSGAGNRINFSDKVDKFSIKVQFRIENMICPEPLDIKDPCRIEKTDQSFFLHLKKNKEDLNISNQTVVKIIQVKNNTTNIVEYSAIITLTHSEKTLQEYTLIFNCKGTNGTDTTRPIKYFALKEVTKKLPKKEVVEKNTKGPSLIAPEHNEIAAGQVKVVPNSSPEIAALEKVATHLLKTFGIKTEDLSKPHKVLPVIKAALDVPTKKCTKLALQELYNSLNSLDIYYLKKLGESQASRKLPEGTTINKRICTTWGDTDIKDDLKHLITPVYKKLQIKVNSIQEEISNLFDGDKLIAALHGIVDTKGGGHVFTDTFLKKTTGDKAAAEDYIKDMFANFNVPQIIKLSREIEKFAAIIYQKSVCYIKARDTAIKMKGDALKLLEQFFATAGIENMAEWTTNKDSGKYVKIMLLRDALVGSVIGPIEKKINALAGGDGLLTSLNSTISNLEKEPILSIDFLDDINGNEFLAKQHIAKKYQKADLPKEIKLLEEYAKNVLAKSVLYIKTIALAKGMGDNASKLSEQFFTATIGLKNMAEWAEGKKSPRYKRILILKQALTNANK